MIRTKTVLFAILILSTLTTIAAAQKSPKRLKFSDLAHYNPENQTFQIDAQVLDVYKCPPCPPHAMCKPCIPDNIVVVDRIAREHGAELIRLRIYTEETDKFVQNGNYRFTVKVRGKLSEGAQIADVDLISFEPLFVTQMGH
ncbi:MAG: hypothetical protein JO314_09245 [Acidobacteria bacterium]|nr:hypothetical protein [Acidobacteriota bacterium]